MPNPFFSGRIPPGLADKIEAHLLTTGETRSELLVRLLRAEVDDNTSDNTTDNNNDNILLDLISRVEKLEQMADNKLDNKTDNILIGLALHTDDNNTDNSIDNTQADPLKANIQSINLTTTEITNLKKIRDRVGKVAKTKSTKLADLGLIVQVGEDLILTKLGEEALDRC